MGYAFISYSTKNQAMADAIRNTFTANKIDTWMAPYSIPPGSKYAQSITNAIRNCSCFVLILSNASQASEAVDSEVELATLTFKKHIITVQIEDVVLNDAFTFYIHNKQILTIDSVDVTKPAMQSVLAAVIESAGQTLTPAQANSSAYKSVAPTPTSSPKRPVNSQSGGSAPYVRRPSQTGTTQTPYNTPTPPNSYGKRQTNGGYATNTPPPPPRQPMPTPPTPTPQPTPQRGQTSFNHSTGKSRIIAGILAILFGFIGLHNFYLKRTFLGVLYVIFCFTYIPAILSFIEGIIILSMTDQAFSTKYKV